MPLEVKSFVYTVEDIQAKCKLSVDNILELAEEIWPKGEYIWEESDTFTSWQMQTIIAIAKMAPYWNL